MGIIGKSQLMEKYQVGCLKTWSKMLEPVKSRLRKNCKIYYPSEVQIIKNWLEEGRLSE